MNHIQLGKEANFNPLRIPNLPEQADHGILSGNISANTNISVNIPIGAKLCVIDSVDGAVIWLSTNEQAAAIPQSLGAHHCINARSFAIDSRHQSEAGNLKQLHLICEKTTTLSIQFYR